MSFKVEETTKGVWEIFIWMDDIQIYSEQCSCLYDGYCRGCELEAVIKERLWKAQSDSLV